MLSPTSRLLRFSTHGLQVWNSISRGSEKSIGSYDLLSDAIRGKAHRAHRIRDPRHQKEKEFNKMRRTVLLDINRRMRDGVIPMGFLYGWKAMSEQLPISVSMRLFSQQLRYANDTSLHSITDTDVLRELAKAFKGVDNSNSKAVEGHAKDVVLATFTTPVSGWRKCSAVVSVLRLLSLECSYSALDAAAFVKKVKKALVRHRAEIVDRDGHVDNSQMCDEEKESALLEALGECITNVYEEPATEHEGLPSESGGAITLRDVDLFVQTNVRRVLNKGAKSKRNGDGNTSQGVVGVVGVCGYAVDRVGYTTTEPVGVLALGLCPEHVAQLV